MRSNKPMKLAGAVVLKEVIDLRAPEAQDNGSGAPATGQQSPATYGRQC